MHLGKAFPLLVTLALVATLLPPLSATAGANTAPAVENLKNGGFEGAPSTPTQDDGYTLSGTAASSGVAHGGAQSIDLGTPGPSPQNVLGGVTATPYGPTPIRQLSDISYWYDVPNAPARNVYLQAYLPANATGTGTAADVCLIGAVDGPLAQTSGWTKVDLPPTTVFHVADGSCTTDTQDASIATLRSSPATANMTLLSLTIQSLTTDPAWPAGFPVLVDDASILASFSPNVRIADDAHNACGGASFATIQPAFSCATPGATILVQPGTYVGDLNVPADTKLCSTYYGGNACSAEPAVTTIQASGCYPVSIYADHVTIDGFTITSPDCATVDGPAGKIDPTLVTVYGSNFTLQNSVLTTAAKALQPGQSRWATQGVYVDPATGADAIIRSNTFSDLGSARNADGTCANEPCRQTAIHAKAPRALVYGNLISVLTNVQPPYLAIAAGDAANVSANYIQLPVPTAGFAQPIIGVQLAGGATHVVVAQDQVYGHGTGVGTYQGILGAGAGARVTGNVVSGVSQALTLVGASGGDAATIAGNTFANDSFGVVSDYAPLSITSNRFDNASTGVALGTTGAGDSIHGNVFRWLGGTRQASGGADVWIRSTVTNAVIDLESNDWMSYTRAQILENVTNDGAGNAIDVACYLDADGATHVCAPTVAFTASTLTPHFRTNDAFTGTATTTRNDVASYAWNFGDGTTSASRTPTHAFDAPGTYQVTFTATDTEGFASSVTQAVNVTDTAPVLADVGNLTVNEGDALSVHLVASDADHDPLTYSTSPLPAGATFDTTSATFAWRPTFAQAGTYFVDFTASDGFAKDTKRSVITVVDTLPPPVFTQASDVTVGETKTATTFAHASVLDGSPIALSASGPAFLAFTDLGNGTGRLDLAPGLGQAGTYNVTLTAVANARTATTTIKVTVLSAAALALANDATTNAHAGVQHAAYLNATIRNDGLLPDTVSFTTSGAGGWRAHAPAAVTLAPGESALVTLVVDAPTTPAATSVTLVAHSSVNPALSKSLGWRLDMPVVLTVTIDPATVLGGVTGHVHASDLYGLPLQGSVKLTQTPTGPLASSATTSSTTGTTDANGDAAWSFGNDAPSRLPGSHALLVAFLDGTVTTTPTTYTVTAS